MSYSDEMQMPVALLCREHTRESHRADSKGCALWLFVIL